MAAACEALLDFSGYDAGGVGRLRPHRYGVAAAAHPGYGGGYGGRVAVQAAVAGARRLPGVYRARIYAAGHHAAVRLSRPGPRRRGGRRRVRGYAHRNVAGGRVYGPVPLQPDRIRYGGPLRSRIRGRPHAYPDVAGGRVHPCRVARGVPGGDVYRARAAYGGGYAGVGVPPGDGHRIRHAHVVRRVHPHLYGAVRRRGVAVPVGQHDEHRHVGRAQTSGARHYEAQAARGLFVYRRCGAHRRAAGGQGRYAGLARAVRVYPEYAVVAAGGYGHAGLQRYRAVRVQQQGARVLGRLVQQHHSLVRRVQHHDMRHVHGDVGVRRPAPCDDS